MPASAADEESRKRALILRRCMLLAVAGGTPPDSPSLSQALAKGYLDSVKNWLDDILSGSIGSIDLLLHLLSNIVHLPVTKNVVKTSGMGKAIGQIEKHPLCVGSANETAITERVQQVKDAWNASVKHRKSSEAPPPPPAPPATVVVATASSSVNKRSADSDAPSPAAAPKKTKTNVSSFSSLLQKVSGSNGIAAEKPSNSETPIPTPEKVTKPKKVSKRVKWVDHFGGDLTASQMFEADEPALENGAVGAADASVSWSDRKKRDRMREKELLSKVKKSKLMDDDGDEELPPPQQLIPIQMAWHTPSVLPDLPDVTKPDLTSSEVVSLNERMAAVLRAVYRSEYEVPTSPTPLSDVEQALDMTSQSSSVVQPIPFFVPPAAPPVPEVPVAYAPAPPSSLLPQLSATPYAPPPPSLPMSGQVAGATPEFVQALGLPMFLVGQDIQALQTLASSPSLLSTLVDHNGMYDQVRLMTLVQTLSGTSVPAAPAPLLAYQQHPSQGIYGPASVSATPTYGQPSAVSFSGSAPRSSFRSNNPDGNLHISGYGPSTTEQDIINLFAPYVIVDEVVMKGNFAFVNTSDPDNAQRAREALTGSYLGGMAVRINPAQRKPREGGPSASIYGGAPSSSFGAASNIAGSFGSSVASQTIPGMMQPPMPAMPPPGPSNHMTGMMQSRPAAMPQTAPQALPPASLGVPNIDAVRDDRGNPATKNLFVAGYGQGTTEQQIRDLFGQHVHVVGVVLKGAFTFVNTADRTAAVVARNALSGMMLNGGALRINFAKETGRLGTSFDLTYGTNTGPNARRGPPGPPSSSYYGRG